MAQAEKHLLWHPRRQHKFVVGGGSQISMYEWAADRSEIRHLSSQSDLSFMKVSGILQSRKALRANFDNQLVDFFVASVLHGHQILPLTICLLSDSLLDALTSFALKQRRWPGMAFYLVDLLFLLPCATRGRATRWLFVRLIQITLPSASTKFAGTLVSLFGMYTLVSPLCQ